MPRAHAYTLQVTCTPDSDGVGVLVDGHNMHTNDARMWTESFNPKVSVCSLVWLVLWGGVLWSAMGWCAVV